MKGEKENQDEYIYRHGIQSDLTEKEKCEKIIERGDDVPEGCSRQEEGTSAKALGWKHSHCVGEDC